MKSAVFPLLPPKSLSENSKGPCFRGKGRMARRDEGAYPTAVCDRGATKPVGPFRENPAGDGSFGLGLRWLGRYSPLRGCAGLAALAQAKIPRRRASSNFQTGSKDSAPQIGATAQRSIPVRDAGETRAVHEAFTFLEVGAPGSR